MKDPHTAATQRYFECLARFFPVMCASDEFHFLPRAAEAARHYDKLEDLSAGTVAAACSQIESFRADFVRLAGRETDLEKKIDLELLAANAAAVIIELSLRKVLHHNPLVYLKIAAIGLDHALSKPADRGEDRLEADRRASCRHTAGSGPGCRQYRPCARNLPLGGSRHGQGLHGLYRGDRQMA